tara:strand:+ start:208 stop:390 length:183 start_codon:yes stop_codon:yes gene_type:complete
MTFEQTSELLTAMNNISMYAEARTLELSKASDLEADFDLIRKYEKRIADAKKTIWDIANA